MSAEPLLEALKAPAMLQRPRCPTCDKRRRPLMLWDSVRVNDPGGGFHYERRDYRWSGEFRGYGVFCTLRCAEEFAHAAHRAGYRIKREAA